MRKLESNSCTNEHTQTGRLGHQGRHRPRALLLIGFEGRLGDLLLVGLGEPSTASSAWARTLRKLSAARARTS
jgi:hypothetical protein